MSWEVVNWNMVVGLFLVTSPLTSYLDTLLSIYKSKSSAGFSLDICGIMLVSSIFKVFFYFGRPYEMSLFIQAWIMIAVQVVLLKVALQYRPRKWIRGPLDKDPSGKDNSWRTGLEAEYTFLKPFLQFLYGDVSNSSSRPFSFWEWESSQMYWTFLLRFSLFLAILQLLAGRYKAYVEAIGLVGLLIEAILPLPQILTNADRGSVEGFRPTLMISWLGGDVVKMFFFVYSRNSGSDSVAPQFLICAVVQSLLDLFIGVQFYMYSSGQWVGTKKSSVVALRQRAQSLKLRNVPEINL